MKKDKRQSIILNYLKNILEVEENEDYINDLFGSMKDILLTNLGNMRSIEKYNKKIDRLEDEINKRLNNTEKYISYIDKYLMILNSKEDKIHSLLYKHGISDGLKIVEGTFKEIDNLNEINKQAVQEVLNERLKEIIEKINDSDMIKIVGMGVAMGNAHSDLKKIANYITETNDNNGIAIWINVNGR